MVKRASRSIRDVNPDLPIVLGGVSSCDCDFLRLMAAHGVMEYVDAVGVHGFPLDWNHWQLDEWPDRIARSRRRVSGKPVWVLEVGASSFGAEEVQAFGLAAHARAAAGQTPSAFTGTASSTCRPTWPAETRHKEAEGSSYYRHYYLGLLQPRRHTEACRARLPHGRLASASASGFTSKTRGWTMPSSG